MTFDLSSLGWDDDFAAAYSPLRPPRPTDRPG